MTGGLILAGVAFVICAFVQIQIQVIIRSISIVSTAGLNKCPVLKNTSLIVKILELQIDKM